MNKKRAYTLTGVMTIIGITAFFSLQSSTEFSNEPLLGHGNKDALSTIYSNWKSNYEASGGSPTTLKIPLAYSRIFSETPTLARGLFKLDLMKGDISVQVKGLDNKRYDLWLVDNKEGDQQTVKPEPADGYYRIGELNHKDNSAELITQLKKDELQNFKIDMLAITPAGIRPDQSIVISGAPGALQRLYYSDKLWTLTQVGEVISKPYSKIPFEFLLPKSAQAANHKQTNLTSVLGAEIAEGRRLFINETFNGNGRTCVTCHRLDNNHTIDPKYIAKLPKNDPLFVAETRPALKDLEKPRLMREMGLVLSNIDGFDKPGVMRSVPHLLALSTSITTELVANKGEFPQDEEFEHALGWSGDGSVGNGSLREFTIGAVVQHFPKTLNRQPGKDFRLPTDAELTAIELYMLSLGRSEDLNLSKMTFKSEIVQRGKVLFDTKENPVDSSGKPVFGKSANCNGCHSNAGAISSTTNGNPTRDTGIEMMMDQAAVLLDPDTPMDGGFGTDPHGDCSSLLRSQQEEDAPCNYGEGRFNTPTLVEAADTAPFFHNNSVSTIEEAVAYYNTEAFNNSPGHLTSSRKDRQVKIGSSQVVAVALFLRSINALENIRNSNHLLDQAMKLDAANGREMVKLAMADTEDAIEVLTEGQILPYPEAVKKLEAAYRLEATAALLQVPTIRNPMLRKARNLKSEANSLIVDIAS
ncbi:hypothetical protein GO003_019305 [Methylicorpusculum oleiharenae]|uniref:hypothetical protein n=1 Tax=Methylicorpusculum oleiharenae TaxID=1338687 RepID=UPI0013593645|nr:hypothetical protein [Methylicorpusculum oleiharenae]MCD2452536.1 hypothetical protein [Methylicorpusculum oleiharenae]